MSEHTTPLPVVPANAAAAAPDAVSKQTAVKSIGFRLTLPPRETVLLSIIALLLATGPLRNWILVPGILILATGALSLFMLSASLLMGAIGKVDKSRTVTAYRISWATILVWVVVIMF